MATFNYQKWERWNVGYDTSNTVFWNYTDTSLTFAEITAAGFFDVVNIAPGSPQITKNDLIYIVASDQVQMMIVDSINPIVINIFNPFVGDFLQVPNNLSDVANRTTALNNIMPASPAKGNVIYFNGTNWVLLPTSSTAGTVLTNNGTGTNPSWTSAPGFGDLLAANNLSDVANEQTALNNLMPPTPAQGNILYFNGTNWVLLATSTHAGYVLTNNGTASNPTWAAAIGTGALLAANNLSDVANEQTALNNLMPATPAQGNIVYFNGTNWVLLATSSTAGQVLTNNGTASNPTWTTPSAGGGANIGQVYPIAISQFSN
ncbi:hypothetical protein UFOVP23_45 [uncultured Caudovirales phage]|uniref:Uncharacterized protein n=1 Tax=uncultured Caudovirales phage TaxID=2100421 RepID=A0A6J5T8H0_9CAUD|nr:hypothetical protein UFOVP23_45 [uncultured Caudovirales phage]